MRQLWDCRFDNYTGFPNHTHSGVDEKKERPPPARASCPFSTPDAIAALGTKLSADRAAPATVARADASGAVRNCLIVNHGAPSQLEYVADKMPCWPCNVTFTFAVPTPESDTYIALGFKEVYAAYYGFDKIQDVSHYWGMSTSHSANQTELSGRIVVGYVDGAGNGCARNMRAEAYVGSLVDAEEDTLIQNMGLATASGYTILSFSAVIHAAKTEEELAWPPTGASATSASCSRQGL